MAEEDQRAVATGFTSAFTRDALLNQAAAKIGINEAIATALKHTAGKAVEVDLDDHLGVLSYDVKIIDANSKLVEVRVNAVDGTIKQ